MAHRIVNLDKTHNRHVVSDTTIYVHRYPSYEANGRTIVFDNVRKDKKGKVICYGVFVRWEDAVTKAMAVAKSLYGEN